MWKALARKFVERKNYPQAVKYYEKVEHSIRSQQDWKLYAEALYAMGELEKAMDILTMLIEKYPTNAELYERKALILREWNREEDAIEVLNVGIQANSQEFINWYTRGLIYRDMERYEEAIYDFHQAIQLENIETVVSTYYELGVAYFENRQFAEAIEWFSKTIDTTNTIPHYYYMLAISYAEYSDLEQAIHYLEIGKDFLDRLRNTEDEGYSYFVENTSYSYQAFKSFQDLEKPTYAFRYTLANLYEVSNNFTKALAYLDEAIEMFAGEAELHLQKAKLFRNWNLLPKAHEEIELAISLQPTFILAYIEKADMYRLEENKEAELEIYNQLHNDNPLDTAILYRLIDCYFYYEHYEEALSLNSKLINLEDVDSLNFIQRADILYAMNNIVGSIEAHEQALTIDDDAQTHYNLSYIYYEIENYEQSLYHLQKAGDIDRIYFESGQFYAAIGTNYKALGMADLAIEQYSKAIELDPQNIDFLWHRAECRFLLGNYHETLMDCSAVIKENEGESYFYELRARAYFHLNLLKEAKQDIEKFISLEPLKPIGYYILGVLAYEDFQTEEAMKLFDQAIQLDNEYHPAYLFKAQIHEEQYETDLSASNIVQWALYYERTESLEQLERVIAGLENFELASIELALQKVRELYGISENSTYLN